VNFPYTLARPTNKVKQFRTRNPFSFFCFKIKA
jgi:hypothetical protein